MDARNVVRSGSLFLIGLAIAMPLLVLAPTRAIAAPRVVDPQEIALSPADLPSGFVVDASNTGRTVLPDGAGELYRVDMKRQPTTESVADGPVIVQQLVLRVDPSVPAAEMLAFVRDEIVREAGMRPTTDGPNDGGTVSLKRQDGDVTLYSIGFAKDQMVIFTTTGGLSAATTFPKLVELAGISSAKLDAALVR